jgi:hypothetical protein
MFPNSQPDVGFKGEQLAQNFPAIVQANGLDPEQTESDAIAFQYVIQPKVSPG